MRYDSASVWFFNMELHMKNKIAIASGLFATLLGIFILLFTFPSCGSGLCNGTEGSDATSIGIGASCGNDEACTNASSKCLDSTTATLSCLTNFKGGYCGRKSCTGNKDCASGSACVAHTDGSNYCFLTCSDKSQCNTKRSKDVEANCSSSVTFIDANTSTKACIPPS
jgi:hypothetical protein